MFWKPAAFISALALAACGLVFAQEKDTPYVPAPPPAKAPKELIVKQEPARVIQETYARATKENTRIVIKLARQRAFLMVGDEVAMDTPISSGRAAAPTPVGTFPILEKIENHSAAFYGDFVDAKGRIVRSGVSMKLDAAPADTRFVSVPMRHFCRFSVNGFGLHDGLLPGYPAAQCSVRVPPDIARLIYEKVRVGTMVEIVAE